MLSRFCDTDNEFPRIMSPSASTSAINKVNYLVTAMNNKVLIREVVVVNIVRYLRKR